MPFQRDNCANCTANTTGEDSAAIQPVRCSRIWLGSRKLLAETKIDAAQTAVVIVDAGQRSRSVGVYFYALLDEFTSYQVVGSVVDYQAIYGYVGSGFDYGEGA